MFQTRKNCQNGSLLVFCFEPSEQFAHVGKDAIGMFGGQGGVFVPLQTQMNQSISIMKRTFLFLATLLAVSVSAVASTFYPSRTDFRDEQIYFVITTRFYDGDPSNNVQCWENHSAATQVTIVLLLTLPPIAEPMNRPMSISTQYRPAIRPAAAKPNFGVK